MKKANAIVNKAICILFAAVATLGLTGCEVYEIVHTVQLQSDQKLIQQRQKITQGFNKSPDTDAWHEQRQQLAKTMGDRIFDKDFGRVFDSLVVTLGNLELTVKSMERTSGFISASGITLPPTESSQMYREAVNEWCKQNGYDPSVLDKQFKTSEMRNVGEIIDAGGMKGKYEKMQHGLTFQLIKMTDTQTKVKLRFSDVYYPAEVEAYYKLVWSGVDKQIFVDQNIEGGVEKRN